MFHVLQVQNGIPKAQIFQFENYWLEFASFLPTVEHCWNMSPYFFQPAKCLNAKLKSLRHGLKKWSKKLSNLSQLIDNCSWVLALLYGLEEQRFFSFIEINFRTLVGRHLLFLLEAKRVYWKQRSTTWWVTLGDENTKFFHAFATRSYRRNFISTLRIDDSTSVTNHDLKAGILFSAFKDRLGCTDFTSISYNLQALIQPVDLPVLDNSFSDDEIQLAVAAMPSDHAPGPDGFKGYFYKKMLAFDLA